MLRALLWVSLLLLMSGGVALGQGGIRVDAPFVLVDPIVDGGDSFSGEWTGASVLSDGFLDPTTGVSPAGFFYYQNKNDWLAESATDVCGSLALYPGPTFFIAHDIFGAPTGLFAGFRSNDPGDWNYVKVQMTSGTIVECWNFGGFGASVTPTHCPFSDLNEVDDGLWLADAGGLAASSLIPEGPGADLIDDRGFIVRRDLDPTTDRHWFPGDPEPGRPGWSWDAFYGCFARAGFNKTFQDNGTDPDPSHAVDHECYEWAFHDSIASDPPLQCLEFRIVWIDPPKRWIVFVAPDWFIHFGFPPVPAFPWEAVVLLAGLLGLGGWWAFKRRPLRPRMLLLLLLIMPTLAACGGGGGNQPGKGPPRITLRPPVLREGWLGHPYNDQLVATGMHPPFSFTQSGGAVPPGLTLASDGTLSGLPTQTGIFGIDFDVQDSMGGLLPGTTSLHIGDGPVPPNGLVPIELVSLSLQSASPIIVSHPQSPDPRLREAIGVFRVRGGDPQQPYDFQVQTSPPPGPFLCSAKGVMRYQADITVPPGQYPLDVLVQNGTAPPGLVRVILDVQVP